MGSKLFRKELLSELRERVGPEHYGAERQETMEAYAEGLVVAELRRRGWAEEELGHRAKGDAGKVAMAMRLRAQTTVTVRWIADRLRMGTPGYLNHLLYRERNASRGRYTKTKN